MFSAAKFVAVTAIGNKDIDLQRSLLDTKQIVYIFSHDALEQSCEQVAPPLQKTEGHKDFRPPGQQIFLSLWAKLEHATHLTTKFRKADPLTLKEDLASPEKEQELELGHRSPFPSVYKSI